ncbi:hypothetical protein BJX76DRAFT_334039 [Aspergillus varians]
MACRSHYYCNLLLHVMYSCLGWSLAIGWHSATHRMALIIVESIHYQGKTGGWFSFGYPWKDLYSLVDPL